MVRKELFLFPILFLLWRCPAGPPTGPDTVISQELSANCLISPFEDTLKIFVSNWSEISEYEYEDEITSETRPNPFWDYWSVSGAEVRIAVDGKYLPVEEDTVTDYSEFYDIYHYYYYKFPNVNVYPGQRWELYVSHPDYGSLYVETIVPDSVEFFDQSADTIRDDSGTLNFAWTQAEGAEGYLPRLMFIAEKNDGNVWQQQIHLDFTYEGDGVYSFSSGYPQKERSIQYPIKTLIEQVKYFYSDDWNELGDFSQFDSIYIQLYVFSMNEALYHIQRWGIQPDKLSGFNAPIRVFTNVDNGSGILGAFWHTKSPEIPIKKELLVGIMQNR
ncbi:DUF4249 domain-containing protein [bacterium]|nr:DUF4249 domain-containing protein [bacterium]